MTDLTKITMPFGLLDDETRAALTAHSGPWEFYDDGGDWLDTSLSGAAWAAGTVYRVKPASPKPREWWIVGPSVKDTEAEAQDFLDQLKEENLFVGFATWSVIRVREVLE
jgi:hypothetical protein